MDIVILTTVVLASIALEGLIFRRAQKRAQAEETIMVRLARYAGREPQ